MNKVITAREAVQYIKEGDTIGVNGFGFGFGFAEEIAKAMEERYMETKSPQNLTLLFASGCGDGGYGDFGLNHLAHKGMLRRVIGGHLGLAVKLSEMIVNNQVEAYNFPQGVIAHLFREIAGGKPGVLTQVGLQTFADPRVEGGKMNDVAIDDLIEVMSVKSKEYLFYKSMPVHVAIIRGTTADSEGNISIEHEGVKLETYHIAAAAKNSGGIVIAQVERITTKGTLKPLAVEIPGILVDYVVVAKPENHKMNVAVPYNPSFTGEIVEPLEMMARIPMNMRKIICKRSACELKLDTTINLGIGVPEGIAAIAVEEGIDNRLTMTIEAGAIGGIPGGKYNLGASSNVEALIGQPNIFDFYDGGGLDIAFLGLAQCDAKGNINVSKFNGKMVGCGGFVNITQNTKHVVFCGTFTAGKSDIRIEDGKLNIIKDGTYKKFVKQVEQITFSGTYASATGQQVLYITERAVFQLIDNEFVLIEIAPGVDLQKHILDLMDFTPKIANDLKLMDARLFYDTPMHLWRDNVC